MDSYRDIVLSGASVRNGRIYLSASDKPFFGPIEFGERTGKQIGTAVELQAHGQTSITDIRLVSGQRIGPRASLSGWFRAIKAQEGTILRLTRTGERSFKLDCIR